MHGLSKAAAAVCCLCAAVPAKSAPRADSIEYALPRTQLRVNVEVVLEGCPEGGGPPDVRGALTMQAVAVAGERHRISGQDLSSFLQRRELSLSLYENGTLKSIGAGASDRTAPIIGNVVRMAASAATLGFRFPALEGANRLAIIPVAPPPLACTPEAAAAVAQRTRLVDRRDELRRQLAEAIDPAKIAELRDGLTAVATRIVELEQGPLKLTLTSDIDPGSPGGTVHAAWENGRFDKWFVHMPDDFSEQFRVPVGFALPLAAGTAAESLAEARRDNAAPRPPYIVLREPVNARISVTFESGSIWTRDNLSGSRTGIVPVAQWGGRAYYSMRAGFGRSRSLKLELDQFGRRTSMAINSESSGEAVTGALASIGESAVAYQAATSDTRQQLLRINELETEQKYNRLRHCAAVIEAGGFTCPQ